MEKTSQQKWELLAALYQHGTNVEKLGSVLQSSWNKTEIIAAMTRYARRAQKQKEESNETEQRDVPLQQWLSYIKNIHTIDGTTNKHRGRISKDALPKDFSPIFSKVMLYAACFEEHYQGTSKDDPNYSAIYRYLSQLLAGEEPTQLTPPSAAKVLEMINRLKKIINHKDSYEYFRSLHSQNPLNPKIQTETINIQPQQMENPAKATETAGSSNNTEYPYDEGEDHIFDEELDESDPYFDQKKERLIKRFAESQRKVGSRLLNIPGVNPLKIKENDLVKPKNPTNDILNPAKKRKVVMLGTDKEVSITSEAVTAEKDIVITGASATTTSPTTASPTTASPTTAITEATVVPLSKLQQIEVKPHSTTPNMYFYAPKTK